MTDYISREAAMNVPPLPKEYRGFTTMNLDDAYELGWDDALQNLKDLPAADVRPVVRGEWETNMWFITCSVCGYTSADTDDEGDRIATNYCPNCGADMRKEGDK